MDELKRGINAKKKKRKKRGQRLGGSELPDIKEVSSPKRAKSKFQNPDKKQVRILSPTGMKTPSEIKCDPRVPQTMESGRMIKSVLSETIEGPYKRTRQSILMIKDQISSLNSTLNTSKMQFDRLKKNLGFDR